MVKVIEINGVKREKAGKGAARAVRRTGYIPAVIYGDKKAPEMFNMEEKILVGLLDKPGFWTHQFEINVDGQKTRTLCQDVQFDRLSDRPIHADFLRISKDAVLTMEIPLHFENEETALGIKDGGVLNVVHRSIEVLCSADNIPEKFVLDIGQMQMGESKVASDIELPKGVQFAHAEEADMTVVTIVEPIKEEAASAAEEAAPAAGAGQAAPTEEKKE